MNLPVVYARLRVPLLWIGMVPPCLLYLAWRASVRELLNPSRIVGNHVVVEIAHPAD